MVDRSRQTGSAEDKFLLLLKKQQKPSQEHHIVLGAVVQTNGGFSVPWQWAGNFYAYA